MPAFAPNPLRGSEPVTADQLLEQLRLAHQELASRFDLSLEVQEALVGIRKELATMVGGIPEEMLRQSPALGEWSALQNLEHLRDHDCKFAEVASRGISHYIAHGREHTAQVRKILRLLRCS